MSKVAPSMIKVLIYEDSLKKALFYSIISSLIDRCRRRLKKIGGHVLQPAQ